MLKNKEIYIKGLFFFLCWMVVGGWIVLRRTSATTKYLWEFFSWLERKYIRMEQVSRVLEKNFYDKELLSWAQDEMIKQAIESYVDWLWDPFTTYLNEENYSELKTDLEWTASIEWIGAVVSKKDYYIQVEEVLKNTPAYISWLQPLDRIVLIWTWETKDMTTVEAVSQMRGPKWTSVFLFIERVDKNWEKQYLEKEVKRDVINVPSVTQKVFEENGVKIWYIEVSMFWDQTNRFFTRAITELLEEWAKWLIIDLRGNGGWLLTSAVELAGHFIPKDEIVVKTKYSVYEDIDYKSKWFWELEKMPIVILVDWLSASSSEILAIALKERNNATIVWRQSFWKWSIQTLYNFDDKTSLKYTVWKRFSPSWKTIDWEGITPDVDVPFDLELYKNERRDNQLEKAKEVLIDKIK